MANTGNTQQQINYGAAANDGQGDPLRTAFIKTDDNFDNIWLAGPVGSNITIVNNTVQSNNTNGNIVLRPNGVGVIQANASVIPNASNLRDLGTADLRFRAAYVGTGGLSVDGNVTVTGNLTAGNISYTGNVFVGDLQGSVYADDSTIMVDAVDNKMFADSVTFGQANITGIDVANITHEFPIGIQTSGGGVWEFAGNILRGPQGGSWQSDADTAYFNSPANGYLNLTALQNGNVVSELFMEHSFIRFFIDNGIDATWELKADGRTEFPGYTFPYADGNAGEVLKTDGAGNLAWAADSSDYGNANVAEYLISDFGTFGSNAIVTAGNVVASVVDTGALVNDSTIGIQGGEYLWQFAGNILRSPEGGTWQSAAGTEYISSNTTSGFIQFTAYDAGNLATELFMEHGFVRIRVDNGGPEQDWNFRLSGVLEVPGDIIPSSNGTASLGNATNYWSNLWVANNTIYIGGVPLGVTGNVLTVNGEPVLSNDSDSSITTTGNIAAGNILTDNYLYANGEPFVSASTGNITFTDTTMSPPDGSDMILSAANSEVDIQALDFRVEVTDDVRITGNNVVSIRNRSTIDPINIITDFDNTSWTWEFGADGAFIAPGDITVNGDVTGTPSSNTLVLKAQTASNTYLQLNNSVDSVISTVANLEVRTDVDGTAKTWEFDINGDLTVPGYVQFEGNTFIGDEPGGGSPVFRIVAPLTYGATIETDSDISGNSWTWTFGVDGVLGAPGNITATNFIGNITGNTAGFAIGYRDIPQVAFTGNATLAATDAGKHFYSTESTDYILTIADNSAVSWPVGTAITVVNRGTGNITVAQAAGVSLYLAGNSSAGNRTVTTYGMATVLNVAANVWMINGTGVS